MKFKCETMGENKSMVVSWKNVELTRHQKAKQIYFCMFWKKTERRRVKWPLQALLSDSRICSTFTSGLTSQTAGKELASRRTFSPNVSALNSPWCWWHPCWHPAYSPRWRTASRCKKTQKHVILCACSASVGPQCLKVDRVLTQEMKF